MCVSVCYVIYIMCVCVMYINSGNAFYMAKIKRLAVVYQSKYFCVYLDTESSEGQEKGYMCGHPFRECSSLSTPFPQAHLAILFYLFNTLFLNFLNNA